MAEIKVHGKLYDGRSSSGQTADVVLIGDALELQTVSTAQRFGLSEVVIRERIANNPRVFEFPGGVRFETPENDVVDRHFVRKSGLYLVHFLEHHWGTVLVATSLLVGFALFNYYVVLPKVAQRVAYGVKQSTLEWVSDKSWEMMDDHFAASKLSEEDKARVEEQFELVKKTFPGYRMKLELRQGKDGVELNAFALPDGRIVFTDKMVELLKDPDQVTAVMMHEMGHVVYRHGLQNAVQALAVSGFFMLISGGADWSSIAGVVVSQTYSRDHEREADYFAADEMKKLGKKPSKLADALENMRKEKPSSLEKLTGFLSSHPITEERVKYLRAYDQPTE